MMIMKIKVSFIFFSGESIALVLSIDSYLMPVCAVMYFIFKALPFTHWPIVGASKVIYLSSLGNPLLLPGVIGLIRGLIKSN